MLFGSFIMLWRQDFLFIFNFNLRKHLAIRYFSIFFFLLCFISFIFLFLSLTRCMFASSFIIFFMQRSWYHSMIFYMLCIYSFLLRTLCKKYDHNQLILDFWISYYKICRVIRLCIFISILNFIKFITWLLSQDY